jgi:hypothetical protein
MWGLLGRRPWRLLASSLLLLFFSAVIPGAAQAAWTGLGGELNVSSGVDTLAATAVNGVPYVAWDGVSGSNHELYVKQWSGSAWTEVGAGPLNVSGLPASNPSITSVAGVPYVAFFEENIPTGQTFVYVENWNGTTWVLDGSGPLNVNSNESALTPSITGVDGVPYVAFEEVNSSTGNGQIYVEHWTGTGWAEDGGGPLSGSSENADAPSITGVDGMPYVSFSLGTGPSQIIVEHLSGNSWTQDGNPLNVDDSDGAFDSSIEDIGGVPWVAFDESDAVTDVYVKHLDGETWEQDGDPLNLAGDQDAWLPSLANVGGTPYVAFEQLGSGVAADVDVEQWTGTAWAQVDGSLNPGTATAQFPSLANVGGAPFVAFGELPSGATQEGLFASLLTPDFSAEQAIPTDSGALLTARVSGYGVAWPIGFSYGPGASLANTTPVQTADGTGSSTIVQAVSGLTPAFSYAWQPFAVEQGAPLAVGTIGTFTTEPASPGPTSSTGSTGASTGTGQTGPAGAAGPPGEIELVTCQAVTKTVTRRVNGHNPEVKQTVQQCSTKLVSAPLTFTATKAHSANLTRGRTVYARVETLRTGRALRLIVVHRLRKLTTGRYTLVSGRMRQAIQLR